MYNRGGNDHRPAVLGRILEDGKSVLDESELGNGATLASPTAFLKHKGLPDTYHLRYVDGQHAGRPIKDLREASRSSKIAEEMGMNVDQAARLEEEVTELMMAGGGEVEECKVQTQPREDVPVTRGCCRLFSVGVMQSRLSK